MPGLRCRVPGQSREYGGMGGLFLREQAILDDLRKLDAVLLFLCLVSFIYLRNHIATGISCGIRIGKMSSEIAAVEAIHGIEAMSTVTQVPIHLVAIVQLQEPSNHDFACQK